MKWVVLARSLLLGIPLLIGLVNSTQAQWSQETRKAQNILATISAAHHLTVWGIIVENKITFKQGMIEVIAQPIPSQSFNTGDTTLDIFFDTHPPAVLEISKEATTDLHARFVKRKGALKWEAVNGWAKVLIQDKMPWK
ncbi:MAG: hypothetical protein ACYCY1_08975 [Sulfuriferula sp.]